MHCSGRADELSQALGDMDMLLPPFTLAMDAKTTTCLKRHELAALDGYVRIGLGPESPTHVFRREHYKLILKARDLVMSMSKDHCEVVFRRGKLFATNLSQTSTTQLNKRHMDVGTLYELHDGAELCLFGWLYYTVQATRYEQDLMAQRPIMHETMIASYLTHVLFMNPLITRTANALLFGERLSFQNEYHGIASGLALAEHPFVGLKTGFATLFNLHKALVDGCCVLHLAGHGLPGQLFFEGEASQPLMGTAVDAEALDQCLQLAPPCAVSGVQLALLLVCHSASMAGPFVRYGIPHVIAVDAQSKLQDWVAPVFAQRLYMELGTGQSVQTAFDRAIAAVRSHDLSGAEAESEKILLLPPNDDHRHVLFPPLRGRVATREPFLKRFPSPFLHLHAAETLEFRQKEAVVVSTYLARPPHHPFFTRLVVLTGPEGVGKTHLARAVGDDLALRGYFDGGVHVIYVQAFADTLDATALGPDGCYDAVQAEVSARLKAFAGARKQQCLVLLDGCDVLMQRPQDAGRFFDSILSSQTDWKLLVTTSVAKTPLELGFSAQSYALQPFPYEAGAQLFAKLLARARYPLSVYHLLETPGFDLEVHADVDLWRVLSTHPISQHVLRGLPGTIARVVDEVVATQTTVDAWFKRSFAP
ncbi:hypothetical protein SDRG_12068 [Saprolegnia diclina VS20]|uniref:NACHT domain-containing protein n=1 Tax=Saprolegnia diclina (strain VS20) TaxID=1156394 RepID=T0RJW9_SAPDV|nr:hypothetical protein SDRG_12068 [Saprolegnia diclina VS20]EQC30217.1 hypothetical protein SDRG_12068 [Saprolegnia diclina VS20]|eukprot:XP_008616349.1 hypothetical protein SDRG_12068 [Saprolegnia diclina VS20]